MFRKPGVRRVIWEKDGAEFKYFVKSSEDSKNKKDACDTSTYGYRGQFLEMKKYPNRQEEDKNIKEEAEKRDELRVDCCKECSSNDENCTSHRYFVESDIDSKYTKLQLEPYRYDAMHILIQCPEILVDFSQLRTSPKPSLANFLKKKLCLSDNLLVHPVYRPHSPAKVPNLQNSELTESDFSHSDFSDSCLEKCDFTKCVMLFAELARAKMSGSTFCETFIGHSNLIEVEADQCEWTKTSVLYSRAERARLDSVVPTIGCNCFTGTSISHTITVQKPEMNCNESKYVNKTSFCHHENDQKLFKTQNNFYRIVPNWRTINAGVPQGTQLGPLFFLIVGNDVVSQVPLYKYVDDSALSEVVRVGESNLSTLQHEVDRVNQWSIANNMKLNVKKTKEFILSFLKNQPSPQPLMINNQYLQTVQTTKLLSVYA